MNDSNIPLKWRISLMVIAMVGIGLGVFELAKRNEQQVVKEVPKVTVAAKPVVKEVPKITTTDVKFEVKPLAGYTAYVIKYVDNTGKEIKMKNKTDTIRYEQKAYTNVEDAQKEDAVFEDYFDNAEGYYFQVKTGVTFGWRITPSDTASISNWADNKADILMAVFPDKKTDSKISERTITVDYSGKTPSVSLSETIK